MFCNAIEKVSGYTRALHTIKRRYGDNAVLPESGTLFFVNDLGYAITAKHVAAAIPAADAMEKKYKAFLDERARLKRDATYRFEVKLLEKRFGYGKDVIMQLRNSLVDCVEGGTGFTCKFHPKYDLAIIKFNEPARLLYTGHAVFSKEAPRQGQYLCRLGFPFPEFKNFRYNEQADSIEFASVGSPTSPRFPLDGMVTRFLKDDERFFGIELSTPGLVGQSGGPLFGADGRVYGLQFSNRAQYLGYSVSNYPIVNQTQELTESKQVIIHSNNDTVTDYPFVQLGHCIHVEVIKEFLRANDVRFEEA